MYHLTCKITISSNDTDGREFTFNLFIISNLFNFVYKIKCFSNEKDSEPSILILSSERIILELRNIIK